MSNIGHNNPPSEFEALVTKANEHLVASNRWVTERPTIESQKIADVCKAHIDQLRAIVKSAESMRKAEVKPLNDQKSAIQKRYKDLTGKLGTAIDLLTKSLTPWLEKVAAEQAQAAEEAQKAAALAEAEAKFKDEEARKALETPTPGADALGALEAANEAEEKAKAAQKAANKAAKAKPQAGKDTGRAMSLTTVWSAEITDMHRALWALKDDVNVQEAVRQAANRYVKEHKEKTNLPGIKAVSERKARS